MEKKKFYEVYVTYFILNEGAHLEKMPIWQAIKCALSARRNGGTAAGGLLLFKICANDSAKNVLAKISKAGPRTSDAARV